MHHEPPQTDISRDPILDGRDSLRLVKLRLALTLVAVAILPIAAVSPLVRAVADEARAAHHELLADQARTASRAITRELEEVRAGAVRLLADPALVAAAKSGATDADKAAAAARLANLVNRSTATVIGAQLTGTAGVLAGRGTPIDLKAVPTGLLVNGTALATGPGGQADLVLVEGSAKGAGPARSLVLTLSLPAVAAVATPADGIPGRSVRVADATGKVLAEADGPFDPSALPGEVLDLATMASHDSDGRMGLDVEGLDGWSVVVSAPIPLVALPVQAISALLAMLGLLVVFTLWMAHQILRPAAALEASRSHLRELYESAREAALRDSLTGLGNHRAFQEAVARMVEGGRRYGTAFSLVLFDIDEFKRINDTRGHAVGDQLLAEVGELIRDTIRHTDAAFRVGGDEFAVLLPHTDAGGAVVLARRLLARGLEERTHGTYLGPISFSAGVTACPEFGTTRLELTAQADAALYRGKRTGRTVVTIYDPARDHGHVDEGMRAELSAAITAVIESGGLTPVYQPIVDLATGKVLGYEGLIRVPRESTFAHAGALFDAAEVAGRVQDLDRAALEVVLRGSYSIDDSMSLSLNVSPRTLEAAEFSAQTFLAILRRHKVPPARVILELTERETVRDPDRLQAALRGVRMAGVRVAADDVGAGNAGLRLLSQFKFDVVKIDLSLVQRAGDGQTQTASVLKSLIDMATRQGATTIAEGVETSAQLRTIRKLGITAGQGYLLGRPGTDRDLTWVDLAALEQREDVAVPVTTSSGDAPATAPRVPHWEMTADWSDSALRASVSGGRRRALSFLGSGRAADDQPR